MSNTLAYHGADLAMFRKKVYSESPGCFDSSMNVGIKTFRLLQKNPENLSSISQNFSFQKLNFGHFWGFKN